VLFVDDDPSVREAVARQLRGRGLIVDLACDGAEALALALESPYAVVATDYMMPGLAGLELIHALQAIRPEAMFVVLTGAPESVKNLRHVSQVHSVIAKPWNEQRLLAIVESGVREAQQPRKRRPGSSDSFAAVGGQFVLLLEDNDLDALVLERAINQVAPGEFRVVRARSLVEARKLLQTRAYSAVLADLGLPDANGLDTLSGLLGVSPDTPILVITGADDESLATQAVRAGAQDYLVKGDYEPEAVLRAMRYAVERKRIELRLSNLAHYDALTGLANRTLLTERQTRALARARRSAQHVALVAVDLDHFKTVNDTHGHDVGDALLVEVGRRLSASTRSEDTVARVGGDEFLILLEDLEGADGARRVAQRIHNAFATPIVIDGKELNTTPSVGIALFPDDAVDLAELQRHADTALYEAKRSGRNAFRFFSQALHERAQQRLDLELALVGALTAGEFGLTYRPEIDLQSAFVCGYEAVLHWDRGQKRLLARDFLGVLEESGDIVRVGKWLLGQACKDGARMSRTARLSVSVSGRELANPAFVEMMGAAMQASGVTGGILEVGFSEATLAAHFADASSKLPHLVDLGVRIAVDDYGGGRSSPLELARLPIHTIRLSEAFLPKAGDGRAGAALAGVVGMAGALGWSVVARGVETLEQLELVRSAGCHKAQGLFCGHAVHASTFPSVGSHRSQSG